MNHLFASYQKNTAIGGHDGNRFLARPINGWRKQYQTTTGYSRASVGMPMDRPGGMVPVESEYIQCATCKGSIPTKVETRNDSDCYSCNKNIKNINNVQLSDKHYNNTSAYLQSRCSTYSQNISTSRVPSIEYFSEDGAPINPTDSDNGTQVRETKNCYNYKPPLSCNTTIYKPNNVQYAEQGSVSSSSRIYRLKYNTLNNNGLDYSAKTAMNENSGRLQSHPSPSYFVKYKPQQNVYYHRTGALTVCPSENTICMF